MTQTHTIKLMTLKETADYLRVNKKTVYRLLKQSKIPATKVGRQWRFEKASIDVWLRSNPSIVSAYSILVVDDEEIIRALVQETLEEHGHQVACAATSLEALALIEERSFDLAFVDLKMPRMDGAELFGRMKTKQPALPVIIITGYPESEIMARALKQGPFAVMNKPFNESDIITAVNNFARKYMR